MDAGGHTARWELLEELRDELALEDLLSRLGPWDCLSRVDLSPTRSDGTSGDAAE